MSIDQPTQAKPKPWLPSERSQGKGRRAVWVSVILGVAIPVAVNAAMLWAVPKLKKAQAIVDRKWQLVERGPTEGERPWLVVGDSSGNQGIDTDALSDKLGAPVYNLCTIGDMLTLDDAWMLDRWMDEHGPPRGVIMIHVYDMWSREPDPAVFSMIDPNDMPPEPDPPTGFTDAEQRTIRIHRWLPLIMANTTAKRAIVDAGRSLSILSSNDPFADSGSMNERGFLSIDRATPDKVRLDATIHSRRLEAASEPPTVSATNRAGLTSVLERCRDFGVPVFMLHAPTARPLAEDPIFQTYFGEVHNQLEDILQSVGAGTLLFTEPVVFEPEVMESSDHLVGTSAAEFSRAVGVALAASMRETGDN